MADLKVAVLQFCPRGDTNANLSAAERLLAGAAAAGARLAVLPEMFSCLVSADRWAAVAEEAHGGVERFLAAQAVKHDIYVVGGSYVERAPGGALYNTSAVLGPAGEILGRYRKMHLFWTDIPGQVLYDERTYLSAGRERFTFDADGFRAAVGICYDLRFPEFFRFPGGSAVDLYCLPAAFMQTTGRAHWEVLLRARAIENLAYVAAAGTVGTHHETPDKPGESARTYGHSMIVGPWGDVLSQAGDGEGIAVASVSRGEIDRARARLAALEHVREDLCPRRR